MKQIATTDNRTHLPRLVLALSAILSLFSVYIFKWSSIGLQSTLLTFMFVSMIVVISSKAKVVLSIYTQVLLSLACLISLFFSIRASELLTFINLMSVLFLLASAMVSMMGRRPLKLIDYLFNTVMLPIITIPAYKHVVDSAGLTSPKSLSASHKSIIKGLLLSLPVLLMFGLLFSSADAVFADAFKSILKPDIGFSAKSVFKLLFAFAVAAGLGGLLYCSIGVYKASLAELADKQPGTAHKTEITVVLGLVNVMFAVFLAVQAVFLFGGRSVVLSNGLTFAEYDRNGFFQLLWVALLVFGLIYGVRKLVETGNSLALKLLLYALMAQVGLVMVSALKRLSLYEQEFGFTELRYYSHSFIFLLFAVFAVLGWVVYKNMHESRLLQMLVILAGAYVLLLNTANPDAIIASKNIERYTSGSSSSLDVEYIIKLSADASSEKLEALQIVKAAGLDTEAASVGYKNNRDTFNDSVPPDQMSGIIFHRSVSPASRVCAAEDTEWSGWNYSRNSVKFEEVSRLLGCK